MITEVRGLNDKPLIFMDKETVYNAVKEPIGAIEGENLLNKEKRVIATIQNHQVLSPESNEVLAEVHENEIQNLMHQPIAKVFGGTRQDKALGAAAFLAFYTGI